MFRLGVLALICMPMVAGHRCGTQMNIATNVEREMPEVLNFHQYDATFTLNASFVGAEGRLEGFNLSKPQPFIDGGGLEEPHQLTSAHLYGHYSEDTKLHTFDDIGNAFEIHLVHGSTRGTSAVVVIRGETHQKSCWLWDYACNKKSLNPLIAALTKAGKKHEAVSVASFSPQSFLPKDTRPYFDYSGSVIGQCETPARYFVLTDELKLSREQMKEFRRMFPDRGGSKL